jgi:hypothetical protein
VVQYVPRKILTAPFTVNTMPDTSLRALPDQGEIGAILPLRRLKELWHGSAKREPMPLKPPAAH